MSGQDLIWGEGAKLRTWRSTFFVRKLAKRKTEKAAIKLKQQGIRLESFETIKNQ